MQSLIPCTPGGSSSWTQRTALGGEEFALRFDWVQRDGHWRLDIADAAGVPIRSGVVIVSGGGSILRGVTDARRPVGVIGVVDTEQRDDVDPGFADLGTRFLLVYDDGRTP